MHKITLILILTITLSFLSACGDSPNELFGTWSVTTDNPQANLGLQFMTGGKGIYIIIDKNSVSYEIGNQRKTLRVKKYQKTSRNKWEILYENGTVESFTIVGSTLQFKDVNGLTLILTRER
jgi:hypothetical protein